MDLNVGIGGKFGDAGEITPLKVYKYYVDFNGFMERIYDFAKRNKLLYENASMRSETKDEVYGKNDKGEYYKGAQRVVHNNSLLNNESYFNLSRDNSLRNGLDLGFYVNNVSLPKYVMKTVKVNYLDSVKYKKIKTSYGGEISLNITSTFKNVTKISLLLGIFEKFDTYEIWDKVYSLNGKTTNERGNGRGMDAVSSNIEVNSPNIDIVLVDDKLDDSIVYRLVNPIVTNVDFGNFSYGLNSINEIRMTINYNSWYIIDGQTRPRDNSSETSPWDLMAYNALKDKLDSIFESFGKTFDNWKEDVNDIGSNLPWG